MARFVMTNSLPAGALLLSILVACTEIPAPAPRSAAPQIEAPKPLEFVKPAEPPSIEVEDVVSRAAETPAFEPASIPSQSEKPASACNPQRAFAFLRREAYLPLATHKAEHEAAIRYRTEHYGWVPGFGLPTWNSRRARDEAAGTSFFGIRVWMNRKVIPALKCVEAEIATTCTQTPYQPEVLSGMRTYNSYHNGEVTNHLYGLAIDIDPHRNSCCNCVDKWRYGSLCRKRSAPIWERMTMPKCWVDVFEKYGFYWLGHDQLEDTMHFEFLADPDRITGS